MLNKKPKIGREAKLLNKPKKIPEEIIHLHASRGGPLLANDIFLSINEYKTNRKLKFIYGYIQPYNPVSKYFNYWFSGFEEEIVKKMLFQLKVNGKSILNNQGFLNPEIINDLASNVWVNWENLIISLFLPIYEKYFEEFREVNFLDDDLKSLKNLHTNKKVDFESGIINMSMFIVNTILTKKNLPKIIFKKINKKKINKNNYFVNKIKWVSNFNKILAEKKEFNLQTLNYIFKKIKSFNNKLPNKKIIKEIIKNAKKKPYLGANNLDSDELLKIIIESFNKKTNKIKLNPSVIEQINYSLNSYKETMYDKIFKKNDFLVIDGKSMLEICFDLASEENKILVLQRFMRGGEKELYAPLIKKYPNLELMNSSCCVWNPKEFPEFDLNLIFGLKYVASFHKI